MRNRILNTAAAGWEHNEPGDALDPGSTRVEVTLTPRDTGTLLVLRHYDMPATHAEDHTKGWNHFLGDRLAALASGR
ncbi:MAG: SRPBCC domain-containing protein [Acidimicrobiales bacterium]